MNTDIIKQMEMVLYRTEDDNVTVSALIKYWFENLNLRGAYKSTILDYVSSNYPDYYDIYKNIYIKGNKDYWVHLSFDIERYCAENSINYINYFLS